MKDLFVGMFSAMIFFGVLYIPLDGELKNLLIGLICLAVLSYYFAKAVFSERFDFLSAAIISIPTLILVLLLSINFAYQLDYGGIYFWLPYAVATAVALRIAR